MTAVHSPVEPHARSGLRGRAAAPTWFRDALGAPGSPHHVEVEGRRVTYQAWGDGDRLIALVHGRAANAHWWDHIAPLLATDSSGRDPSRVIAVDLSGHGDSEHRARYDLSQWAREIGAAINAEKAASQRRLRDTVVIGHSMGSTVALMAAGLGLDGLSGVAALDSPVGVPHRRAESSPRQKCYPTRQDIEARFRVLPDDPTANEFIIRYLATRAVRQLDTGQWTWKTDARAMAPAVVEPAHVARVVIPTLLVVPERGIATAASTAALRDRVSAPTRVIGIPNSGHHVLVDQPLALVAVLSDWLGSLPDP
jgi:pimeloyl-ACP methyl ester carboxylesterase